MVSGTQCYIVLTDLKLPQFLLDVECACIKVILFHRTFSKEQYFDSSGLFFSTVYSTPVLFNCLLLLVSTQIFPVALSRKKKEIPICCKTVLLNGQQFIDLLPAIELLTPIVTTRPFSERNNLVNTTVEILLKSFAGSYSA